MLIGSARTAERTTSLGWRVRRAAPGPPAPVAAEDAGAGPPPPDREVGATHLIQGLHRHAQQRPDEIATVCAGRTRTHAESVDRIARLAAALRDLGVTAGERAAILSLKSDRYSEFLAATLWAGGVVPVNTRWSIPEQEARTPAQVVASIRPLFPP